MTSTVNTLCYLLTLAYLLLIGASNTPAGERRHATPSEQVAEPTLWIRGENVTGKTYHAPQGMGFAPGWRQVTVQGGMGVVRWWVTDTTGGIREEWQEDAGPFLGVNSWQGERLEVRAVVRMAHGTRTVRTVILFDLEPE